MSLLHTAWRPRALLLGSLSAPPLTRCFSCHCCPPFPSTLSSALQSGLLITPYSLLTVPRLPSLDQSEWLLTSTRPPSFPHLEFMMMKVLPWAPSRLPCLAPLERA